MISASKGAAAALAIGCLVGSGCTPASPEDNAIAIIEHAWAGDFESVLAITGDDVTVAGCSGLSALYLIAHTGGVGICPENGSELATDVMVGYFAFAHSLNTRPLAIGCRREAEFYFLERERSEPMKCVVTATNDLLPPGGSYRAHFVFGVHNGAIVAIEEIGHQFEGQPENFPYPRPGHHEELGRALDPHCGGWSEEGELDPHKRPQDRSFWEDLGRQCAAAWRDFFGVDADN